MREITTHRVEGDTNEGLKITVTDEPGAGGANYVYVITGADLSKNPGLMDAQAFKSDEAASLIMFQNGGIPAHGVNGLTHEALLAIVADRLEAFQAGPFPSQENANALHHVNEALRSLQERTRKRIARGVEGQNVA